MILRTFTEPTTIYLIGADFTDKQQTFGLTDDECAITVKCPTEDAWMDTCGFVFIYTQEELDANIDSLDASGYESKITFKDYVGNIKLEAKCEIEKGVFEDAFVDELDLTEYVMYQYKDEYEDLDVDVFLVMDQDFDSNENFDELD